MKGSVSVFLLCVSLVAAGSSEKSACDKKTCPGPLKYYHDLGCKPVFKNDSDCCPIEYDCSNLEKRSPNKCYLNNQEYDLDQSIDRSAGCYPPCFCSKRSDKPASFVCAQMAPLPPPRPGCYRPRNAAKCYPDEEICFDNPEDIPTCKVNGKTINAGDFFEPEDEPEKACWCGPGYKGENIAPFCKDKTAASCGPELRYSFNAQDYCAPVFNVGRYPAIDCNYQWRCHEADDKVTPREDISVGSESSVSSESQCRIGSLTLRVNNRLDKVVRGSCIKCSCDVPPILSCTNLPRSACSENS